MVFKLYNVKHHQLFQTIFWSSISDSTLNCFQELCKLTIQCHQFAILLLYCLQYRNIRTAKINSPSTSLCFCLLSMLFFQRCHLVCRVKDLETAQHHYIPA